MKTLALLTILVAAVVALGTPQQALAFNPCLGDNPPPTCSDPTTETQTVHLTVTLNQAVQVTASGINCGPGGTDCTEASARTRECVGTDCGDWSGTTYTLSGAAGSGYQTIWTGCDSVNSSNQCMIALTSDRTVSTSLQDVADPTVAFSNPPTKIGPGGTITASASDNSGFVAKVDFYVDNVLRATDTSAPYQFSPDVGDYADGSSHTVKVISQDGSGHSSGNLAGAPSAAITIDKSVNLSLGTIPAFVNAPPSLTFSTDADVPAGSRQCGITATLATCSSPFAPTLGGDGAYTYTVAVTDDVGNTATATRSFVLDRTAPSLSFTDGPADGQVVGTRSVTYTWTDSDANPDAIECAVDGAAFGACASPTSQTLGDLTDGGHSFAVRATDKAGNQTTRSRSVVVSVPVQQTPQDTPQQQTPGNQQQNQQTPPATLKKDPAKLGTSFKVKGSVTQVKKLALSGLPTGATVTLTCKGKGCPTKIGAIAVKAGKADLAKAFKKSKLKSGATITIVVTAPGYQPLTIAFKARKAKQPVKTTA